MARNNKDLIIDGAKIGFRNFSGKEGRFNPMGRRNFCLFLDEGHARELLAEGWKVKWLKPRDDQDDPQAIIQVSVRFDKFPPNIVIMSSRGKTKLSEDMVGTLDWAEIENVDVVVNPSVWNDNGEKKIKAYLQSMWVTIKEDPFEQKYINVPDSATDIIGGCGHCDTCDGSCGCHDHDR